MSWLRELPIIERRDRELFTLQVLAWVGLLAALLLPADGVGVSFCLFRNLTGLPCPGCGLTRSVVSVFHMEFRTAYYYHPMGFFAAAAILFFVGSSFSRRVNNWFLAVRSSLGAILLALTAALLVFGLGRAILLVYFPLESRLFRRVLEGQTVWSLF
ncbi:MAG: DUF2752 domain-containing protein [Spirochaetales bacterium]|nr:DUF2752 domain-containing protein [Leptospiraceae bacterium]MCP5480338.1 DUF2752 domain-containing protein [Spirochaetales bacterium]